MPAAVAHLPELLHRVFGHREFRAHQQPSGLPREASREVCRDYLTGNLDFLFIAPERMRVPGFPEMLAKRKPALVAVDEAHCISAWGHDFRPDYRTLGQYLPALRPAPIVALTATATPTVQKDILRALNLQDPAVFITGFRRDNLQIEATELSKPQRTTFITKLLSAAEARPAIVYASSRKSAEEIASALGSKYPAAAYHAGLDAGTRDRVQRGFLNGKLEVVVATIAFGMGVDKADVRTVVHAALPGSVEAYYQEIGRAGRDGKPSRAILLHSFADRKMPDFFIERDYPAVTDVGRLLASLQQEPGTVEALQQQLKMELEVVQRGIEKLVAQGAATIHPDGTISCEGDVAWKGDYEAQVNHRREQVDRIVAFAEGTGCRMSALVRHFGDLAGAQRLCGQCDSCNPQHSSSAPAAQPSSREQDDLLAILHALTSGGRSSGKLFTELKLTKDRKQFDRLLDGLARAGLVNVTSESFRAEDGRDISFRKVSLTPEGRTPDAATLATIWLRGVYRAKVADITKTRPAGGSSGAGATQVKAVEIQLTPAQTALFESLKAWRSGRAKAGGVPAFLIFGDAVLRAIAAATPASLAALHAVSGVGPEKLERFGSDVLALCRGVDAEVEHTPAATTLKRNVVSAPNAHVIAAPKRDAVVRETIHVPGRGPAASSAARPRSAPDT